MVSKYTTNYNLPQVQPTDKVNWFDLNPAFSTIDATMKATETAAESAQNTADTNGASISNLTESLNNTIDRVTIQENKTTGLQQQVTQNTTHNNEQDTHLQKLDTEVAAIQNEIGGAGTGEGGITEDIANLNQSVKTLSDAVQIAQRDIVTNADNIGNLSGLETIAKDNLVNAINEATEKQGGKFVLQNIIGLLGALTPLSNINQIPYKINQPMTVEELKLGFANNKKIEIYETPSVTIRVDGPDWVTLSMNMDQVITKNISAIVLPNYQSINIDSPANQKILPPYWNNATKTIIHKMYLGNTNTQYISMTVSYTLIVTPDAGYVQTFSNDKYQVSSDSSKATISTSSSNGTLLNASMVNINSIYDPRSVNVQE